MLVASHRRAVEWAMSDPDEEQDAGEVEDETPKRRPPDRSWAGTVKVTEDHVPRELIDEE